MKTLIMLFAISMLVLGSCTETIYEEIIKLDTVFLTSPSQAFAPTVIIQKDTVVLTDTVEVKVIVRDTIINTINTVDTLIQVVTRDSIIIKEVEKIVNHYDTIVLVQTDTVINNIHHYDTIEVVKTIHDTVTVTVYDRTVIYKDTFYLSDSSHPYSWVPNEIVPFVTEFVNMAYDRGKTINGQPLVIQYVHADDLPGESWTSFSYHFGNQYVIELSEQLPTEQQRAGVFREMARLELVPRKKYSSDVNKVMCPLWSPSRVITTQDLNELYK